MNKKDSALRSLKFSIPGIIFLLWEYYTISGFDVAQILFSPLDKILSGGSADYGIGLLLYFLFPFCFIIYLIFLIPASHLWTESQDEELKRKVKIFFLVLTILVLVGIFYPFFKAIFY